MTPSVVIATLRVSSKKQLIQELARHAAPLVAEPEARVFDVLIERERLGSTGIGGGIAIPHGRIGSLSRVIGIFARLERPVPFDAVDDMPVDLVYMLLAPTDAGADHLKALAHVSRTLRDQGLCERLRNADGQDAIRALLGADTAAYEAA